MTEEERTGKTERVGLGSFTQAQVCIECGAEYVANHILLCGEDIDLSHGRCRSCVDVRLKEEETRENAALQTRIISQRRQWRESCGIPPKFMNGGFGTFDLEWQPQAYRQNIKKTYQKCLNYAEHFPLTDFRGYPSLLLFSIMDRKKSLPGNGIGKSHLTCAIAHRILDRWNGEDITCPVYCISEYDIFTRIQETFNYSPEEKLYRESEADIIRHLIGVPLLIVDDIGKEKRSDTKFVQRTLFKIIDGRYKIQRPMVITANLSPDQLKVYLGGGQGDEASFDRIWELCQGTVFKMEGESYRRRKV